MYEKRFGLHRKPFQAVQKPTDYFPSAAYREILPAVLNALKSDLGVAVLTGPSGVGKTVTLESFRQALQPTTQTFFVRGGAVRGAGDLLYALHRHLVRTHPSETPADLRAGVQRWDVVERLQRLSTFWGPLTILLDDVHLVEEDVFSELRSLLEEEADGQKLVRLLIAGPILLEEVLAQPSMGNFSQKIRTHVFLEPLRSAEAVDYLAHHVANAGADLTDLFHPGAVEKIVVAADGMPRCLNLLADEALMICEETDQNRVTAEIVNNALKRLLHLPVSWNASVEPEQDSSTEDQYNDQTAALEDSSPSPSSVVEFHSVVSESSSHVIEIGSSLSGSSFRSQTQNARDQRTEVAEVTDAAEEPVVDFSDFESGEFFTTEEQDDVELDSDCCDFVPDAEAFRDAGLLDQIAQISDNIGSMELPEVNLTDLGAAVEISDVEFFGDDRAAADGPDEFLSGEADGDQNSDDLENLPAEKFSSLEHHLLLASGSEDEGADCAEDVGFSDIEDAEEILVESEPSDLSNEHLFDAILAEPIHTPIAEDLFTEYTAWQPAGEWPSPRTERSSELAKFTSIGNASPVFDRYTWSQLGRAVAASPRRCREADQADTAVAEWPPQIAGLAPFKPIPILDIHASGLDLLPEWEVTGEEFQSSSIETPPVESVTVNYTPGEGIRISDLGIDSDLLKASREPVDTAEGTEELHETSDVDSTPASEGKLTLQFFEEPQPTPEQNEAMDTKTDNTDLSVSSAGESGPSAEVAALIANAVERFMSGTRDDNGTPFPTPPSPSAVNEDGSEIVVAETIAQQVISDLVDENDVTEYAPRLLQEARSRIVSVLNTQGHLRQAAGAESSVRFARDSQEVTGTQLRLAGSAIEDDAAESDETEVSDSGASAPRFRDLFTRLRNMNKRSA